MSPTRASIFTVRLPAARHDGRLHWRRTSKTCPGSKASASRVASSAMPLGRIRPAGRGGRIRRGGWIWRIWISAGPEDHVDLGMRGGKPLRLPWRRELAHALPALPGWPAGPLDAGVRAVMRPVLCPRDCGRQLICPTTPSEDGGHGAICAKWQRTDGRSRHHAPQDGSQFRSPDYFSTLLMPRGRWHGGDAGMLREVGGFAAGRPAIDPGNRLLRE